MKLQGAKMPPCHWHNFNKFTFTHLNKMLLMLALNKDCMHHATVMTELID